jgi:hypothetical protein
MVLNATFNNISVITWQSVLLVEKTEVLGENHRPATSHWQTLSHYVVLSTPHLSRIQTHNVSGDTYLLTLSYQFLSSFSRLFVQEYETDCCLRNRTDNNTN